TIPIVAAALRDPVGEGLAASLARPAGNVTGLVFQLPGIHGKRLELFRSVLPRLARMALLWDTATQSPFIPEVETAAQAFGIQLESLAIQSPDDLDHTFDSVSRASIDGVFALAGPTFFAQRARIVELVTRHQLPAAFAEKEYAEAGGLLS